MFTAKRKEAYLRMHPQAAHGSNQHSRSGKVCNSSFADDQAAKTGVSKRPDWLQYRAPGLAS